MPRRLIETKPESWTWLRVQKQPVWHNHSAQNKYPFGNKKSNITNSKIPRKKWSRNGPFLNPRWESNRRISNLKQKARKNDVGCLKYWGQRKKGDAKKKIPPQENEMQKQKLIFFLDNQKKSARSCHHDILRRFFDKFKSFAKKWNHCLCNGLLICLFLEKLACSRFPSLLPPGFNFTRIYIPRQNKIYNLKIRGNNAKSPMAWRIWLLFNVWGILIFWWLHKW